MRDHTPSGTHKLTAVRRAPVGCVCVQTQSVNSYLTERGRNLMAGQAVISENTRTQTEEGESVEVNLRQESGQQASRLLYSL